MRRAIASLAVAAIVPLGIVQAQTAQELVEMPGHGLQHDSAWALYESLRGQAGGGDRLQWASLPDWTGIYTKVGGPGYETGRPPGAAPTARLTPEYQARFDEARARAVEGVVFDPLSVCAPSGYPRWLSSGYLREFVVTPDQTWMMNETDNETRRVYTDGRGHPQPENVYPIVHGDSIGFWDDGRLIVHTNQISAGVYGRNLLEKSDQLETVEIWQKQGNGDLTVDVWHYDPPVLLEPWHVRHTYELLNDPDRQMRIRYWYCTENQNNAVYRTEEGGTAYTDLDFLTGDDQ